MPIPIQGKVRGSMDGKVFGETTVKARVVPVSTNRNEIVVKVEALPLDMSKLCITGKRLILKYTFVRICIQVSALKWH